MGRAVSRLDYVLFHADPTGLFVLAFLAAVALLVVGTLIGRVLWLCASVTWELVLAALQGRRERLERERRRTAARGQRPGPNWLAADLRRRRAEGQS